MVHNAQEYNTKMFWVYVILNVVEVYVISDIVELLLVPDCSSQIIDPNEI